MRLLTLIFVLSIFGSNYAQESLEPLIYNAKLQRQAKQLKSISGTFIYSYDTLSTLPIIDDFSSNKFKPRNAQIGDPNVTDSTWFALYDGGIAEPADTCYVFDTTFTFRFDSLFSPDTMIVTKIANPSKFIDIYDLDQFPLTFTTVEVWPPVNYEDSTWNGVGVDVAYIIPKTDVDVIQDSATVYLVATTALDADYLWIDSYAYRNNTYAIDPPSYGVATFDGLDENGYPYNFGSSAADYADYLTSVPIDLSGYNPLSGVELTFLYQPEGLGNKPESTDSLIVEFWSPLDLEWTSVWRIGGSSNANFEPVFIPVDLVEHLQNGFQFRIKNYGARNGSLDHWHIDYVRVRQNIAGDELLEDLAIREPVNTLLNDYTSMPWSHFYASPDAQMANTVDLEIYNSSVSTVNASTVHYDVSESGSLLSTITDPNTVYNVLSKTNLLDAMNVQNIENFVYDTTRGDTCVTYQVEFGFSPGIDLVSTNKRYLLTQHFSNYYAYDDGSAEAAYGVTGAQPKIAVRFTSPIADTLRAVDIHFEPAVNDMSNSLFYLSVWSANGSGGSPGSLIYENDNPSTPEYNIGVNGFATYSFDTPQVVNGSFYVGWRQVSSDRINVGIDLNIDNSNKIYYDVAGSWENTSYDGSLLVRPVFKYGKDNIVGVNELASIEALIYPNPTNDIIQVKLKDGFYSAQITDLNGRLIVSQEFYNETSFSLINADKGIYLMKISDNLGNFTTSKVIKQ